MANIYLALIHHPVVNKNGDVIASAVTNLDIHDIARAGRTYGVRRFFIVTPLEDQKVLTKRLISHWDRGAGARYNPDRKEALGIITVSHSFREVVDDVEKMEGRSPAVIATSAGEKEKPLRFDRLKTMAGEDLPILLLFGTAWGLAPELLETADAVLESIRGPQPYNHLSVRSAVSIVLDRLRGMQGGVTDG